MAQKRYISTNFWKDSYVIELDPTEKLMFLYLLTNPQTNIAGAYEISTREIAFDTGYDQDMVKKILARFNRDGKIHYAKGWIVMRNWVKHQSLNPNMKTGLERTVASLPKWLQEYIENGEQTALKVGVDESL